MIQMKKIRIGICIIGILTILLSAAAEPALALASAPPLGAVKTFSILAGQTVTNTGPTTVIGDVGVSPGGALPPTNIVGFPPGIIGPPGTKHDADAGAAAAQASDTAAFGFLDQTPCTSGYTFGLGTIDLAGKSLGPGIYCADAFILTGHLTLSGSGVWIFKSASTLITSPGSSVSGDDPCNVWWRVVSSATLDTTTVFIGNILALTSISLKTGASLNGRALAQVGSVTMDSNGITSQCGLGSGANNGIFGPGGTFTEIPEYPWGVFLLLILMLPVYMVLKRRNRTR
jgi:hypothetical protein